MLSEGIATYVEGVARVQAMTGDTIVHLEEMRLASSRARTQFIDHVREKGFTLDEGALLVLEGKFRAHTAPPLKPFEQSNTSPEPGLSPSMRR